MKSFNASRPLPDQILESILDYPDEWNFDDSNDAVYQHEPSGLALWVNASPARTRICKPQKWCDALASFTLEEKTRIFKTVMEAKQERNLIRQKAAEKAIVNMLNTDPKLKPAPQRRFMGMNARQWLIVALLLAVFAWI